MPSSFPELGRCHRVDDTTGAGGRQRRGARRRSPYDDRTARRRPPPGDATMRKAFTSLVCCLLMTGVVVAAEVTLLNYEPDKKELTVKEGDVEKTYKLTEKTKVYVVRDGKSEDSTLDAAVKVLGNPKAKGKLKFELKGDRETVAEIRLKPRKGK
jgi:hypothetical protein